VTGDKWFPSIGDYVLSMPCPTCAAPPWVPCHAPNKIAKYRRANEVRAQLGQSPETPEVTDVSHGRRHNAGAAHRDRDIGNAPWFEDREPGKSYGTIPPRPEQAKG